MHPIRPHQAVCILARRSGKTVSDAQTSRPSSVSIFPNFVTEPTDTIFGGRRDRWQHRGDPVGGGRRMGEGPGGAVHPRSGSTDLVCTGVRNLSLGKERFRGSDPSAQPGFDFPAVPGSGAGGGMGRGRGGWSTGTPTDHRSLRICIRIFLRSILRRPQPLGGCF